MTTWLTRCFAFLSLMLPFVPAAADDPDDKEIARLVKQLGSSDYRTRDAATKRLQDIGEPACDALVRAMKINDVEARRRAEQIVAVIEDRLYGPELGGWRATRSGRRSNSAWPCGSCCRIAKPQDERSDSWGSRRTYPPGIAALFLGLERDT